MIVRRLPLYPLRLAPANEFRPDFCGRLVENGCRVGWQDMPAALRYLEIELSRPPPSIAEIGAEFRLRADLVDELLKHPLACDRVNILEHAQRLFNLAVRAGENQHLTSANRATEVDNVGPLLQFLDLR